MSKHHFLALVLLSTATAYSFANETCEKIDGSISNLSPTITCFESNLDSSFNKALSNLNNENSKLSLKNSQEKWAAWIQAECNFRAQGIGIDAAVECRKELMLDRIYFLNKIPRCDNAGCEGP